VRELSHRRKHRHSRHPRAAELTEPRERTTLCRWFGQRTPASR
jgi:hypothetical protein